MMYHIRGNSGIHSTVHRGVSTPARAQWARPSQSFPADPSRESRLLQTLLRRVYRQRLAS